MEYILEVRKGKEKKYCSHYYMAGMEGDEDVYMDFSPDMEEAVRFKSTKQMWWHWYKYVKRHPEDGGRAKAIAVPEKEREPRLASSGKTSRDPEMEHDNVLIQP